MGLIDFYEPRPPLRCPVCGVPLGVIRSAWQGTDGPRAHYLWRQGEPAPIDQLVDEEWKATRAVRRAKRLPPTFDFFGAESCERHWVHARGAAPEGVWTTTELIKAAPHLTPRRGVTAPPDL